MAKVIVGMTTSLDGFVVDASGSVDRLYPDLAALQGTTYMNDLIAETGAVLIPPRVTPKQDEHLTFTFVTDGVESAIAQARAAARGKDVQVVGGISAIQQVLRAGLADELHLDVMPVLLGAGRRLFEPGLAQVELEKIGVQEAGARTSLRFRVKK